METRRRRECRAKSSSVTNQRCVNLESLLAMDWLEIARDELHIKKHVGAGSFGTVHRAEWHGSDVAIKVLTVQDFEDDQLKEFLREVAIVKRVRHPNLVLFMGAVTKPPHLSIVTEYLPRGSLFQLLHLPDAGEVLDPRRRLRMALDVAKSINYLHCLNPPIVHWDLKSPNLLVDKNWTVKVYDFGLSRFKANTFVSSKYVAGTELQRFATLRIYYAGIWHNATLCVVCALTLFLLPFFLYPFYMHGESPMFMDVSSEFPLSAYLSPGDLVVSLDGNRIHSAGEWTEMAGILSDQTLQNSQYYSGRKGYCIPGSMIGLLIF